MEDDLLIPSGSKKNKVAPVEVEVILVQENHEYIQVRISEDSKPITLPKSGVKVLKRSGKYLELSLSERKAINYNLI
jgi:hypothetical protein